MQCEKSCGAVVFTKVNGSLQFVLIRQLNGHWGFPKGHVESGETEEQTALREIYEEVHLRVRLLQGFRETDEYALPNKKNVIKQVVYFCAEYAGQDMQPQKEEVQKAILAPYEEALRLLSFESAKCILRKAQAFIAK